MLKWMKAFIYAHWQTKLFVVMGIIYMAAIIWTTLQTYARLEYSRSDREEPIIIQVPTKTP